MNVARIAAIARRFAGDRGRHDGESLLFVGLAVDGDGGARNHSRRGRRGDWRRRGEHH